MRRVVLGVGAGAVLVALGALSACGVGSDCDFGLCAGAPADGADGGPGQDGDAPDVVTPPDCDDKADAISDAAKGCVVDSFALFVDGDGGNDTNDGSKAKPLKSIVNAVAKVGPTGKRRIYICGSGTYAEHLKLTTAANLHGGFACSTWTPDATAKPKVAPTDKGYALHIDNVSAAITVSDVELSSADASALKDGTSSIAVFANKSNVSFLRTAIHASNGADGAPGAAGGPGVLTSGGDLNGNPATGPIGGLLKTCTCSTSAAPTKGGVGGSNGSPGGTGEPNYGAAAPNNGAGGASAVGENCDVTASGHKGADAPSALHASAATTQGALSTAGWQATKGDDATDNGKPGQGGGGGGSRNASTGASGGGCGGCGGFAGKGGGGGGASIALLANDSAISLNASTLEARKGGAGGVGGAGGAGANGGTSAAVGACLGGNGGRGADGGAGAGGAGGVAVGILYKGTTPVIDSGTTVVPGQFGGGGKGGNSPDNDGPIGVAEQIQDATKL